MSLVPGMRESLGYKFYTTASVFALPRHYFMRPEPLAVVQWRFPRSKRKRIRKKWAKDPKNIGVRVTEGVIPSAEYIEWALKQPARKRRWPKGWRDK